jgi:hypothetical protein
VAHLKYFAHRIPSSRLWSSEKRPVKNAQSASCSSSSDYRQRKEQLGQCPNMMVCRTELDPGKPFFFVLLKKQEEHSTQVDWFWFSGLFDFLFLGCRNKLSVR